MDAMSKTRNKYDIVNGFADYFLNGVVNLTHTCPYRPNSEISHRDHDVNGYLYIPVASYRTIKDIIDTIKIDKSPGSDKIRAKDVVYVSGKIAHVIARMINTSLQNGVFPDSLKISVIRPVYKSKDKKQFSNYRPIAILPTIEKIFERYVSNYLNKYLKENNILNPNQYGFQKNKSTEHALKSFANKVNGFMNSRSHALASFIDLSKAFDTIEHKELLKSLEGIGIRGIYLSWFESYLRNRKFTVKVENEYSDLKTITLGVPQGSLLGPIMFLIYLNGLFELITDCTILAYADDIVIISGHRQLGSATEKLNRDFKILTKWAHDKKLIINGQKTAMMHFCPQNMSANEEIIVKLHGCDCLHKSNININCDCDNIRLVDKFKYLGLTLDRKMIFNEHIYDLHKRLNPCVAAICTLSDKVTNNKVKMVAYQSLVESNIRYGIGIWGAAATSHLNIIKNLQNRCLIRLFGNNEMVKTLMNPKQLYIYRNIMDNFNKNEQK
ncbi:hypothetical protein J6590_108181 [Homalodisca vitripennis]|nr:hypothetical protein J6590_108181 [Homalodisca vitripennis]